MSLVSFSFVGYAEVKADGTLEVYYGSWLASLPYFNLADHVDVDRMVHSIFGNNNVTPDKTAYLPAKGYYRVAASGFFSAANSAEGMIGKLDLEKSSHSPVEEHQMMRWFVKGDKGWTKNERYPTYHFNKINIKGDPKESQDAS